MPATGDLSQAASRDWRQARKIDLKLNCKHPQAVQTMAMVGSYSPEAYTMTMTMTNAGGGPAGEMTMKMKVDAKRIGECDGKEKAKIAN